MINPAERIRDLYTCLVTATSDCDSVLELGCGFGEKLACVRCGFRVGVDIHEPYLERAREIWGSRIYFVWEDALNYAMSCPFPFDCILMIDSIEHLEKEKALKLLSRCQAIARRRIIIFTPEGEYKQDHDPYYMGGDVAQTHKSAWTAEEFKSLGYRAALWENWHENGAGAVFATWERDPR